MLGIKVLRRRHVPEHIEVASLRADAVVEQAPIVLDQVTQREALADIAHLPAVPIIHERNVALLPAAETCAGKGAGILDVVFLVGSKLRVPRRRIDVVVAVLVMQHRNITKLPARIDPALHAFPAAGGRSGRQHVGMLTVVALAGPGRQAHDRPFDSLRFQRPQLGGALVECRDVVIEVGIVRPIAVAARPCNSSESAAPCAVRRPTWPRAAPGQSSRAATQTGRCR